MSDLLVALVFFNIFLDICIIYKLITFPIHGLDPCFPWWYAQTLYLKVFPFSIVFGKHFFLQFLLLSFHFI